MNNIEIIEKVKEAIAPIVRQFGLEIDDIEYRTENNGLFLRIFLYKENGKVNLEDCRLVSKAIEEPLDAVSVLSTHYNLEVSSPGLDRPLTKERHFIKHTGEKVWVKTKEAVEGQSDFHGIIKGVSNGEILLDTGKKEIKILIGNVANAKLQLEFL